MVTGNDDPSVNPIPDKGNSTVPFKFERELVVVAKAGMGLRSKGMGVESTSGSEITQITNFLSEEKISIHPLFGINEERMKMKLSSLEQETTMSIPDLSLYYRVEAPNERLDALAEKLRQMDVVETAYVKPAAEPAVSLLNQLQPKMESPPNHTPDFTNRQGYLDPSPGGIDARYAWTRPGGLGQNVRIIDIEGAWRFSHEDLIQNQGGVVGGTQSSDILWRNHGTAVIGEFGGDRNTTGVTGICPDANVSAISIFGGTGSAGAITAAADRLRPGDIILIELHRPGPRFNYQNRPDQLGFIAIEWWDDDFAAIRYASSRGVIVVEAAGNGAENLDDPLYNLRPSDFPASWSNPFNRNNRDSGAILVGAGAPPPGTHGQDHGPDRSRLDFSNFGSSIDAQGWGREVSTTGYGDLQGGPSEDEWYTDSFSGTSSASPIVVGALGCVQGILRQNGRPPLSPIQARGLLRITGSLQQDATGRPSTQRIGNRPNLNQMIAKITGSWIRCLYLDLLNREPEPAGLNFWIDRLNSGTSIQSISDSFLRSAEYCTIRAESLYRELLDRQSDPEGLKHWRDILGRGTSLQDVILSFCNSPEYKSKHPIPTQFVESLYGKLLGRQSEPSGLQHWVNKLNSGTTTADVIKGFLRSSEYARLRATEFYQKFLARQPDAGGLDLWAKRIQNGSSLQEIIRSFVTSPEYQNRSLVR